MIEKLLKNAKMRTFDVSFIKPLSCSRRLKVIIESTSNYYRRHDSQPC